MLLRTLLLRNVRSHRERTFHFRSGLNLIEGGNGSGKTSVLEAIYLLSTGRSFLVPQLKTLIHRDSSYFYIEALFDKQGIEQQISFGFDGSKRRLKCGDTVLGGSSELLGLLPSTILFPNEHLLISGSPQLRRRFLNLHLAQLNPIYAHHLLRYHRAMLQRNASMKSTCEEGIDHFEMIMSVSGSYLMQARRGLVERLSELLAQQVERLTPQCESASLIYLPSLKVEHDRIEQDLFRTRREKDRLFKSTLVGPHRDELRILYAGEEAASFASEGQKRTLLTGLKLGALDQFKQATATEPLFGIDDLHLHLDLARRNTLLESLDYLSQVFLTTPIEVDEHLSGRRLNRINLDAQR